MYLYWQSFLDLVFPRVCVVCNETILLPAEEYFCTHCRSRLPLTDYHRFPQQNPMYERIRALMPASGVFALLLFTAGGKTQKLLHTIKYKNQPELAALLGRWLGRRVEEEGGQHAWDAIVPVPLYHRKFKQRGYNQSAYFARGLAHSLQLPVVEDALIRVRATETQTRKTRLRRWYNVTEVFEVTRPDLVRDKRLLLVDDVITTGATIASCGQQLLMAGSRSVTLASIASA